jgi:acyl-CoA thioester hydrolase
VDGYPVSFEIEPRFRDTDAMGHLNHGVFVTYFEVARAKYWESLTGSRSYDEVPFLLAHVEADYRSQAFVRERLRCGVRVSRLGNRSFECTYRVEECENGRLVAEGRSVQVMFDYDRQVTIPVPDDFRARVRAFERRPDL